MKNSNALRVLNLLIEQLDIPVTRTSIISELQKHPDSGLIAFSDLLDKWNVPNAAYEVSVTELIDSEIPLPFIACFRKSEFVLVTEKNDSQFVLLNDRWHNHSLSFNDFKSKYQGTILAFQKDEASGEPDYNDKRRKEVIESLRTPSVIAGGLLLFILCLLINHNNLATFSWQIGLLMLLKILALVASVFLLLQSIDANNPLMKKVCGSDSNKNCNAILSSKAAKVIEGLSWSEVGFFYFAGTLLILLFNSSNDTVMGDLALLNILSLPYTFYSIYYQARVAKQWCVFCCSVQALLWMECFTLFPYLHMGIVYPNLYITGTFTIGFLVPVLLWIFIKPHLLSSTELELLKPELYKYK